MLRAVMEYGTGRSIAAVSRQERRGLRMAMDPVCGLGTPEIVCGV